MTEKEKDSVPNQAEQAEDTEKKAEPLNDKVSDVPVSSESHDHDDLEAAWVAAGEKGLSAEDSNDQSVDQSNDDIDDELIAIAQKKRRPKRHPIISVVVIGFSIYLMAASWSEFRYFWRPNLPVDLGEVATQIKKPNTDNPEKELGKLAETNVYARLRGAPDRKHSLLLKGRINGYDSVFRLRRGRNLVFVQEHHRERSSLKVIKAEHAGRLVKINSLPYADSIRDYFKRSTTIAHDLDYSDLAQAKTGKQIIDKQGLAVAISDESLFWINVSYPNEWIIQFSKDHYKTVENAKKQLADLKLPHALENEPSPNFFRFVVLANAEQAKKLIPVFSDRGLHAGFLKRQISYTAKWKNLNIDTNKLIINEKDKTFPSRYMLEGETLKPLLNFPIELKTGDIKYISTSSDFKIPSHAVMLIANDVPRDHWLYVLLYVLLACFIAFNIWALSSRYRHSK